MAECLTIRSIISRFYNTWSGGRKLRADVKRAAFAIINCRTQQLGSHIERCDCGHVTHIKYNSCRHRSCPQCGGGRRADWLEKTSKQLLPCGHVHIIFTVPEELNILWRFNRELFAEKLMTAARQTLESLLADEKYLGAKAGVISALHTWGRN
ncbi:MAG TPA: transposase zinc-binding domain-containing protein, partial [Planctomycetaceae bacterium]|nr:transposase zinc-binding domain-containing protein [Planctomycetaceae bacterium]